MAPVTRTLVCKVDDLMGPIPENSTIVRCAGATWQVVDHRLLTQSRVAIVLRPWSPWDVLFGVEYQELPNVDRS